MKTNHKIKIVHRYLLELLGAPKVNNSFRYIQIMKVKRDFACRGVYLM